MTTPFMMPPAGFGPGSQPLAEDDEKLEYMPLPRDMRTYVPHVPEVAGLAGDVTPALDLLRRVAAACATAAQTGETAQFGLEGLDPASLQVIKETLGEGEVAAKVRAVPAIAVQESVFAGVWRLSGVGVDCIEVAPVPGCMTRDAFAPRRNALLAKAPMAPGVVNAPPLLVELRDKSASWKPGADLHVVNLSLLPHTEEDLVWLDQALGEGAVTILSRGYGNCRVTATALPHVWRVQFFNSMDVLILDTFEVTEIPEVALAAPEDLSDSSARIGQVIEAIS
ncbi:hydrogenase expression/formation protein [Frigidibacter sp. ROC022]|uniref:hydrogenase expression/formation protein n=1 Tax=Frigidibacter sp. ROC022 TaxID=2971796 RepID=UPI00215B59FE|nr:hydrogenase expression/formation protein [Frigidibacter sp. ROC022]MCR8723106.1 hydrogenase expression/formation protein [Frigidibacter sp. ROC022]